MQTHKIYKTIEDVKDIAGEWQDLQRRVGLAPFTDYDFVEVWWRTIGAPTKAQLRIVCAFEGPRLTALLPFVIRKKAHVNVLTLVGHEIFYYRNFLCEKEQSIDSLWDYALAMEGYDLAIIKNIHLDSVEHNYFLTRSSHQLKRGVVRHSVLRNGSKEQICSAFSKTYFKKHCKTAEAVNTNPTLATGIIQSPEPVPEDLVDFIVERKAAWAQEKGKRGIFNENGAGGLYHEMIRTGLRKNKVVVAWMRAMGRPVAGVIFFTEKSTFYGHTLAYDPLLSKYTPGFYLNTEGLIWAAMSGFSEMNLMEGEEPYKQRLAKSERVIMEYAVPSTLSGRLYLSLYRLLCVLRRVVQKIKEYTK